MARGKGRRGRGRGRRAPIPKRKSTSPNSSNLTGSPCPSNSSAASEQDGQTNCSQDMVEVEGVLDYVHITMSHTHHQLNDKQDENFPIISASQAAKAAEAVVMMDDQVPPPPFQKDTTTSGGHESLEMDIPLQPLPDCYNFPTTNPNSAAGNDEEAAVIVEGSGSKTQVPEMNARKRIYYVDIRHFYQEDSDEVGISMENNCSPGAGAGDMMEAEEGVGATIQLNGRPIPAIEPKMLDHIDMLPGRADLDQSGSASSVSTWGSRKHAGGSSAKMTFGAKASKRRRMKTPPPPRQLRPRACKVVSKFTNDIKQKVVAYIKQVKKAAEEEDTFPQQTEDSWITAFIQSAFSVNSQFTSDDVRIWINRFPQIFTPEAIRNLREHCNRLGEEDEADDEASDSDYDVKYDPLQIPLVDPKEEPHTSDEQNVKNEDIPVDA